MIAAIHRRSGELCLSLLFVSALSGFILSYQYEPHSPFISTVAMESALSFGAFFRSLHFWSSQAFFIMLIWHAYKNIPGTGDNTGKNLSPTYWGVLTSTIFLGIYTLFSGYILRFDQTGQDAGTIAEHLMVSIPGLGGTIERLLLALRDEGVNRVYAVHIFFTILLWWLGTWYHLGRTVLRRDALYSMLSLSILMALGLWAPLDPKDITLDLVKGPWFFLGLQELLRHIPPFWAGVVYPGIPFCAFFALCFKRVRIAAKCILIAWFISYGFLSVTMIMR